MDIQGGSDKPYSVCQTFGSRRHCTEHLTLRTRSAAEPRTAHLAVHEPVEVQVVAAEDRGAAGHVHAQGQGGGGEDDLEVPQAEEDLHAAAVPRAIQTDSDW